MSEEVQQVEESQIYGPGPVLKAARLEKGLTVEHIASQIHLKASLILALEEDKYDPTISMTFIKGYLKLYARQVDVSEAQVLDGLDNLNMHKKEPAKLQSFSRRVAHQANDDKLMLVTYFILAVVVALVVVWWFQQSDNDKVDALEAPVAQTQPLEVETLANREVPNPAMVTNDIAQSTDDDSIDTPVSEALVPSSDSREQDGHDELTEDSAALNPQNNTPEQATSPQAEPSQTTTSAQSDESVNQVELVFKFADDCWVSVVDASGETIAVGVKVSGRVMAGSGMPPFEVILGAPSVVTIRYADEDVDMSFLQPNSTAKFTLPLSL